MAIIWDDQQQAAPPKQGVQWDQQAAAPGTPAPDYAGIPGGGEQQNLFDKLGMSLTPREAVAHPYMNAAEKTATDVLTAPAHFVNQLLLNNPRVELAKRGIAYPETDNPAANVAAKAAGVGGIIANPLNRIMATRVAKGGIGILQGAAGGAAIGGLTGAENTDERTKNAALGAVIGGGASALTNGAVNVNRVTTGELNFLKKTRGSFEQAWRDADNAYGAKIAELTKSNPTKTVDLKPTIDFIKSNVETSPQLASLVKNNNSLQVLLNHPELADKVTLREAQDVLNSYTARIPKAVLTGRNADVLDMPALEVVDRIKDAQAASFPEMSATRAKIAAVRTNYDMIANKIKPGALENSLANKFGSKEVNAAAKELLKDNPDAMREINSYRRTTAVKNRVKQGLTLGGIAAGGKYIWDKATGH